MLNEFWNTLCSTRVEALGYEVMEEKDDDEAAMEMPGLWHGSHAPDSWVQALWAGGDRRAGRYGFPAWWTGQRGTVELHSCGRHFVQAEAVNYAGKAVISVPMRKELEEKLASRFSAWSSVRSGPPYCHRVDSGI
jgi:hypothetical protein